MKSFITISLFIILGLISNKQKVGSTNTSEIMGKMNISNEKFVGSWELLEWSAELTDGKIVFPFGEDAIGRITYDDLGNMAVQIMENNRSQFQSEDPLQAQPDEIIPAYRGFLAYCGDYEVHPVTNQVTHQIKISSFPNWIGQNQVRYYEFREDKMILSTDIVGSSRHKLIWKRAKN